MVLGEKKVAIFDWEWGRNLIVRDVLRFQFLSTILTGIPSRQNERKRFGFLKEEQNSVVIHR